MANNSLYENIQINHCLLKTWEEKFICSDIMHSIMHYNTNQHKREGYVTELNNGNFRNDLNAVIVGTGIDRDHINSSCIYNDIDN